MVSIHVYEVRSLYLTGSRGTEKSTQTRTWIDVAFLIQFVAMLKLHVSAPTCSYTATELHRSQTGST